MPGSDPIDPDLPPPRPAPGRLRTLGAVAAGGAIGAPARYLLGLAFPTATGAFPLTTLVINLTGSLVLGILLTVLVERWPSNTWLRPFAATGIVGSYTTWSTFMVDDDRLLGAGHVATALGYTAASMFGGLAAVAAGIAIGRRAATGQGGGRAGEAQAR